MVGQCQVYHSRPAANIPDNYIVRKVVNPRIQSTVATHLQLLIKTTRMGESPVAEYTSHKRCRLTAWGHLQTLLVIGKIICGKKQKHNNEETRVKVY